MKKLTIAVSLVCLFVISDAKANTYDGKYCLNKDGQKEGMDKMSQKTWKVNKSENYLQVKTDDFEANAKNPDYKQEYQVEKKVQENEWKARGKPIKETRISYAEKADLFGKNPYGKIIESKYNNNFVMIEKRNPNASDVKIGRLNQNKLIASKGNRTSSNFEVEKNRMQEFTKENLVAKVTFTSSKDKDRG
jgi:hypothetical protein